VVVSARGLSGGYRRRLVFTSVDLDFRAGLTALLGPNGAGKTTLLHMICALRPPSGGSLSVLGVDMTRRTARRELAEQIGFLPQDFGYPPGFTTREFLTYAAWLKRVPSALTPRLVDEALAAVQLQDCARSRLKALSGGQRRRVGIAAALVHRPALLVLDEPTAGLDPQQRVDLRDLLLRLSESTSILLSTHLLDDVRSTCDDIVVLDNGEVRFTGSPDQLEQKALGGLAGRATATVGKSADTSTAMEQGYLLSLGKTQPDTNR